MAELLGRVGHMASQAVNCSAPDTGNMGTRFYSFLREWQLIAFVCGYNEEVFARYANAEQQKKWLVPLLNGEIRSAFAMTERFGSSTIFRSTSAVIKLFHSRIFRCNEHPYFHSSGR